MSKHYHLVGIGGVSMSAIAMLLQNAGHRVTGSDRQESDVTRRLRDVGIDVYIGHDAKNIEGAEVVVYTAAVGSENPELAEARRRGIPTVERPVMLAELMNDYKHKIAVAGAHGKTTTVAMITSILEHAGWNPTALLGTDRDNLRLGGHEVIITEACEAFGSFLCLEPSVAVVLNIDADHLDYYGTVERVEEAFRQFAYRVRPGGFVVACADDVRVRRALKPFDEHKQEGSSEIKLVWFGLTPGADYNAVDVSTDGLGSRYALVSKGVSVGRLVLRVPGEQNVINSLAAASTALELGVPFEAVCSGLGAYRGAPRRFEILYEGQVVIVDDYAHHPAEIEATIRAARSAYKGRIIAVFQPHLYTRTKFLLEDFARALSGADEVILAPIYPAREEPIPGVSSERIVERMGQLGYERAEYASNFEEIVSRLTTRVLPGDVVLVMGAGDIRVVAEKLAAGLGGSRS
ncbi:MAG: UDP-N-acetylmuramate--L-alanine ligase [Armatimonadota bacterium]|nr:UDP-N-acetylmuramate--L-alanine ligase [Armatimonadota bacterium]